MKFELSQRDVQRLNGVHPNLIKVLRLAAEYTETPFMVVEGVRTVQKQEQYIKAGRSKTMNSLHLKQADGFSHAVDLCGTNRSTAFTIKTLTEISKAVKLAADDLGIAIEWGGDWTTFKDYPHYQLKRKE